MAKKIFWGFMYLLAAALAVLAVYLYVIPEREIYVSEKIEGEKAPEWIDMPVYTVNGVRAEIGTAFIGGLLDSGLTLKYEVDGKMYDLDPKTAEAAPRTRYEMVLFHEALPVADLTYTNPSDKTCSLRDCEVDMLDFRTDREGWDSVEVLVDGTPVRGIRLEEIPEKYPGFEKTQSADPEYLFSAITSSQSMVAYFRGTADGDLAAFGIRNYLPGSAGTEQ